MLALSIRQPWAWLILHGGKDIENRNWPTRVRGRVLVHAGKGMTGAEFCDALHFSTGRPGGLALPRLSDIQRGGIVGSVELVDCVTSSQSAWFVGRYGFVLRDPRPLPFVEWRGQLGFFDVPLDETQIASSEKVALERTTAQETPHA